MFKHWTRLPPEAIERLHDYAKQKFPDNDILILDDGTDVGGISNMAINTGPSAFMGYIPSPPPAKTKLMRVERCAYCGTELDHCGCGAYTPREVEQYVETGTKDHERA